MCMTLATKNEQGLVVKPYVRFCSGWKMVTGVPDFMKQDIHNEVERRATRYFENHKKLGYARYDSPAQLSTVHQELWAHKTCDNAQTLKTGLAVIIVGLLVTMSTVTGAPLALTNTLAGPGGADDNTAMMYAGGAIFAAILLGVIGYFIGNGKKK